MSELYRKYRPTSFAEVIGQDRAVAILQTKLKEENLPHVVLFTGSTGTGKTTLAQITAKELGCTDANLVEINVGSERGIDVIREIGKDMYLSPMGGKSRVWLLEEVVQLPKATQQASLSILENAPKHVWFLLCTSDTSGLLPTFLGRCFVIRLETLSQLSIERIIAKIIDKEGKHLDMSILHKVALKAEGNARRAIQLLEAVLTTDDEDSQLHILEISSLEEDKKLEFLAKALLSQRPWKVIAPIIESIEDKDLEGIRRQVLAYAGKVLLSSGQPRANLIIKAFYDSWQMVGKAGLISACWDCCQGK